MTRPPFVRVILAVFAAALLIAGPGLAETPPRTSLPDVEDEVMCPICGTLLEHSQAPQADRERVLIRRLIDQGRTKEEIKDALVAEYGDQVLAVPKTTGFDLTAWLIPVLALSAAALGIALGVRRAIRSRRERDDKPPQLDPEDSKRLDADLARHDH
jgi:cytochrome c-type biogenesis protein CcmH